MDIRKMVLALWVAAGLFVGAGVQAGAVDGLASTLRTQVGTQLLNFVNNSLAQSSDLATLQRVIAGMGANITYLQAQANAGDVAAATAFGTIAGILGSGDITVTIQAPGGITSLITAFMNASSLLEQSSVTPVPTTNVYIMQLYYDFSYVFSRLPVPTAAASTGTTTAASAPAKGKLSGGAVAGIVLGTLAGAVLIGLIAHTYYKKRNKGEGSDASRPLLASSASNGDSGVLVVATPALAAVAQDDAPSVSAVVMQLPAQAVASVQRESAIGAGGEPSLVAASASGVAGSVQGGPQRSGSSAHVSSAVSIEAAQGQVHGAPASVAQDSMPPAPAVVVLLPAAAVAGDATAPAQAPPAAILEADVAEPGQGEPQISAENARRAQELIRLFVSLPPDRAGALEDALRRLSVAEGGSVAGTASGGGGADASDVASAESASTPEELASVHTEVAENSAPTAGRDKVSEDTKSWWKSRLMLVAGGAAAGCLLGRSPLVSSLPAFLKR